MLLLVCNRRSEICFRLVRSQVDQFSEVYMFFFYSNFIFIIVRMNIMMKQRARAAYNTFKKDHLPRSVPLVVI